MILLQSVEAVLRAEETLRAYALKGTLTPESAYELVLTATDDEQAARSVKTKLLLNSMPPL